ncbi:MAG: ABC transporter permease subunit [Clostridiaceae bacterium]|nr:ABC transporter permease subunit [Clostridiaceae bacterium]
MIAIFRRELKAYFFSPLGYVFIGFFLLLSGYFFSVSNILRATVNMAVFFSNLSLVFLFLIPILTMRLISEEIKNRTDQLLFTSPVSLTGIVLGKYLAALSMLLITLVITGIYTIFLNIFSDPPMGEIITGYIGFFLLGASFISVGIFISSLTENQIIAAVASFSVLIILWFINWIIPYASNPMFVKVLEWFSMLKRFEVFNMGILSLNNIVYFVSFIITFVFLTIRVLEKRRWS